MANRKPYLLGQHAVEALREHIGGIDGEWPKEDA